METEEIALLKLMNLPLKEGAAVLNVCIVCSVVADDVVVVGIYIDVGVCDDDDDDDEDDNERSDLLEKVDDDDDDDADADADNDDASNSGCSGLLGLRRHCDSDPWRSLHRFYEI